MLTRSRSGLFVSCRTVLAFASGLLLGACSDSTQTARPTAPATEVPSGVLELKAQNNAPARKAVSQDKALEALAQLATSAGLNFHALKHQGEIAAALLEIDLQRFQPRIIASNTETAPSRSSSARPNEARTYDGVIPAQAIAQPDVAVIVGSSFVSQVRLMQPIGVLQTQGKLLQDVEPHGYTRILGIQKNLAGDRFGVAHRSQWPVERFHSALQAGPGIIEQGTLDISERDLGRQKYFRSFVAACGERSVVGTTIKPMHLYSLGSELVRFFAERGLACDEVVNLAGDRESVLIVRDGEKAAYLGDPMPTKAGLIGFTLIR